MKNNFECCYINIAGTYCFTHEKNIEKDKDCKTCAINNSCNYCAWRLTKPEHCLNCVNKEEDR